MIVLLGLILALLPSYLLRFRIFNIPATFLEFLIIAFLVFSVYQLTINSRFTDQLNKIKKLGKLNYAIGFFILAGIISTIISPEPMKALGQLKVFIIEPILVFYASILILNKTNIRTVLKLLFISATLISLFALFQYFTNFLLPLRFWGAGLEPKRLTSIFEYPNALALYLAPLLGLFFILWHRSFGFVNRKILLVGLVVMALALILTFSRGSWIALLLALVIPMVLRQPWKIKAVIIVAVVLLSLIPQIRQRLTLVDPSSTVHVDLIKIGLEEVKNSPFLGNGLSGFRTTLTDRVYGGEILNYPHNVVLNFWLEMGLLGLLAFCFVIYHNFYEYKKKPTILKSAAWVYLVVILIHGLVDVPYFKNDLAVLFWFITSLFYIDSDTNIAN